MKNSRSQEQDRKIDPRGATFVERFGGFLIERGVLGELAVKRAERAQLQSGERFDVVLTRLGLLPETQMASLLADYLGLKLASIADLPPIALFPGELQPAYLTAAQMIPLADDGDSVTLAMADPFNSEAASALAFLLDRQVASVVMPQADGCTPRPKAARKPRPEPTTARRRAMRAAMTTYAGWRIWPAKRRSSASFTS
jgi:general secretion pathway protein E